MRASSAHQICNGTYSKLSATLSNPVPTSARFALFQHFPERIPITTACFSHVPLHISQCLSLPIMSSRNILKATSRHSSGAPLATRIIAYWDS
ncbi:hypothetical protein BLIG_01992 [Bifidobacterium longum subsp. infantis CCUG 52486]|uniref:Uncharacterized protein n=1 Tax=Bifidobacterium longum subsp. infantis CCUG 52486 TaxID=537937 RepID=C5ECW9_BIFLI|nr:hypothetical protein BLIG_01992 [Bifidobacterium longum subsp. infantis CCUG 52486]